MSVKYETSWEPARSTPATTLYLSHHTLAPAPLSNLPEPACFPACPCASLRPDAVCMVAADLRLLFYACALRRRPVYYSACTPYAVDRVYCPWCMR
jgi:hypothetical protein